MTNEEAGALLKQLSEHFKQPVMPMSPRPYRLGSSFAGRCPRGHMHDIAAVGSWCWLCFDSRFRHPGFDPAEKIERVEVEPGGVYPTTCFVRTLDVLRQERERRIEDDERRGVLAAQIAQRRRMQKGCGAATAVFAGIAAVAGLLALLWVAR